MTSTPRSRRAWKFLALLLALPLLGAVVVAAWIHIVADRRWAAAQERIRELSAAFPPPKPRPADATSSEAAKDIQANLVSGIRQAVQRGDLAEDARRRYVGEFQGTELNALLDEVSDVLDRIHQGARRSVASPSDFPPAWRGEWDVATLEFVVDCVILRSRQRWELGRTGEAVETLLDGLPLIRFWGQSEVSANRSKALKHLVRLHDELRELLSREKLSTEELRRIDRELDLSDGWLQLPFRRLEPVLARWSESLLDLQLEAGGYLREAPYRWKVLPERLMKAQAFEFMDRYTRGHLSSEGRPYLDWLHWEEAIAEEWADSENPIISRLPLEWEDPGWGARQRRAEVHLLRAAARYRASGELLQLEDPFGGLLLHSESQDRMRFWSVGNNGKDDGGRSDPAIPWQRTFSGSKDLVIDVERRQPD